MKNIILVSLVTLLSFPTLAETCGQHLDKGIPQVTAISSFAEMAMRLGTTTTPKTQTGLLTTLPRKA